MEMLRTLVDYDNREVYVLDPSGQRTGMIYLSDDLKARMFGKTAIPTEAVAALVEEMTSKGYNTAKARMAKFIEVLRPDLRNEKVRNGLDGATFDMLGILLEDMMDAMRAVVQRQAPEVIPLLESKQKDAIDGQTVTIENVREIRRVLNEGEPVGGWKTFEPIDTLIIKQDIGLPKPKAE